MLPPCPTPGQVLRHDDIGAETLLNLLLRNYLQYNLYDQVRQRASWLLQCGVGGNGWVCFGGRTGSPQRC